MQWTFNKYSSCWRICAKYSAAAFAKQSWKTNSFQLCKTSAFHWASFLPRALSCSTHKPSESILGLFGGAAAFPPRSLTCFFKSQRAGDSLWTRRDHLETDFLVTCRETDAISVTFPPPFIYFFKVYFKVITVAWDCTIGNPRSISVVYYKGTTGSCMSLPLQSSFYEMLRHPEEASRFQRNSLAFEDLDCAVILAHTVALAQKCRATVWKRCLEPCCCYSSLSGCCCLPATTRKARQSW